MVVRSLLLVGIFVAHAVLCLLCQGGWSEVESDWPIAWHDHPMHSHNAVVTRSFLVQNGTTAGYDPYFMSGYAKSIVSDPSGTLIDLTIALFGADRPAMAYKVLVLLVMASLPWWIAWAISLMGGRLDAVVVGTAAFFAYLWTDYPLQYAGFGMTAFLLVVPMGLVGLGLIIRYLDRGGVGRWILSSLGSAVLVLVHPLTVLSLVPAVVGVYVAAMIRARRSGGEAKVPISRHLGLWVIPLIVLSLNVFWWLPGITLAETRDPDGANFFSHRESVWSRIAQIFGLSNPEQPPIQTLLLGGAAIGLAALWRRSRSQAIGLGIFFGSGLFWGYFAGWVEAFDFLQPGRNTYVAYSAAAVSSGIGWSAMQGKLARGAGKLDRWFALATFLVAIRVFLPSILLTIELRTGRDPIPSIIQKEQGELPRVQCFAQTGRIPFLSSRPRPEMVWIVEKVREHFGPGDRIYYEEGGRQRDGLSDPFDGRRYGGLLPTLARVEVIGGPFLNVPVRENFTQFGMGVLFGIENWGREDFDHFARLYGPKGIVCWSPRTKAFCRANPDVFEIVEETDPLMVAKVRGFEGGTIRGEARVKAVAGKLEVEPISADVDGMIVLRYHSVPGLRSDPPGLLREVEEAGDPVPFIGLFRPEQAVTIEWAPPPLIPGSGLR